MIDAGLPLVQCLEILAANQENAAFQKCLNGVRGSVEGGSTLANAMRQYPKMFDDLTTNMIEAGETGGILDTILQRLATYVEKAVKLKSAVKSALIYPVSVISIAAVGRRRPAEVCGAHFRQDVRRPGRRRCRCRPDRHWAQRLRRSSSGGSFLARIGGFFGIQADPERPEGQILDRQAPAEVPVVGMVLRKIAVARFTRTLGTLITSGVPFWKASPSPPELPATPYWKKR